MTSSLVIKFTNNIQSVSRCNNTVKPDEAMEMKIQEQTVGN